MAISTELHATPEQLSSEATVFEGHATNVHRSLQHTLDIVRNTGGDWLGNAQKAYVNQFNQLQDDMQHLVDMCLEYSTDLQEIAKNYADAESDNQAKGQALNASLGMVQ